MSETKESTAPPAELDQGPVQTKPKEKVMPEPEKPYEEMNPEEMQARRRRSPPPRSTPALYRELG